MFPTLVQCNEYLVGIVDADVVAPKLQAINSITSSDSTGKGYSKLLLVKQ